MTHRFEPSVAGLRRLAQWIESSAKRRAAFVAVAMGLALLGWSTSIGGQDEERYRLAAHALVEGRNPYEVRDYNLLPIVAQAGAALVALGGDTAWTVGFHTMHVLGAMLLIWVSSRLTDWSFTTRWSAVAVLALTALPVIECIEFGNMAATASGMLVLGLWQLPHRRRLASAAISLSIAIKPVGVCAIPVLFAIRSTRRAALESGVFLGLLLAPGATLLGDFVAKSQSWAGWWTQMRETAALYAVVYEYGLHVSTSAWLALVTLVASAIALVPQPSPRALVPLIVIASLASSPSIYRYTMSLALPLATMGLESALAAGGPLGLAVAFACVIGSWWSHVLHAFTFLPLAILGYLAAKPVRRNARE